MRQFSFKARQIATAMMGIVTIVGIQAAFAGQDNSSGTPSAIAKDPQRMNCGAKIECTTPDGHAGHVSRLPASEPGATALIMEDDTVTCLLQEGETNFVIELPQAPSLDRFTFLNENAAAKGELRIAVSNHRLSPDSTGWTDVEGVIPFAHKRLFGVSLLGIEARYVRLSFHVEKRTEAKALAKLSEQPSADLNKGGAETTDRFKTSLFEEALNSKFTEAYSRGTPVLLSCISPSVAPLSFTPAD
ncbi:MAG: hypothetical protein QOH39_415 [Verrucomicrobiota bacterium]|jgi:hypothetical protein